MAPQIDFKALAEHIPTLCWIAEADGSIIWYNSRWYEYTGATPSGDGGLGLAVGPRPGGAAQGVVLARWRASISSGVPFDMTFPLRDAGGHFRTFLTRAVPSFDDKGSVRRLVWR